MSGESGDQVTAEIGVGIKTVYCQISGKRLIYDVSLGPFIRVKYVRERRTHEM